MDTQLFTWEALGAMAGASLATFLFVQLTKSIADLFIPWMPTDLYAALVAFAVLFMAAMQEGADAGDWGVWVLSFFNGLLVWATAGKMYTLAIEPPRIKTREEQGHDDTGASKEQVEREADGIEPASFEGDRTSY